MIGKNGFAAVILAAAILFGQGAAADIVILNDGSRLEGIVTTSSLLPDIVLFSDHVNKSLRIPRNRISKIIKEDEASSRLRIARAHFRDGRLEKALEQVREAKRLAPGDPAVLEEERAILKAMAIEQAKKAELKQQQAQQLLGKIRAAIEKGQFEKALPWFAMLEGQELTDELRNETARLKVEFYEKWGDDRADKTDTFGAIECYENALDLDPNAKDVYKKLMWLYEKAMRPGADENRARRLEEYLESKVKDDPKDLDARLRLANLLYMRRDWDGALEHYLAVYRDAETTGPGAVPLARVESRLYALLDGRHRRTAQQGDYERAIEQFREFQSLFPDIDPKPLYEYEYRKRATELDPKDEQGRLALVKYCETYGLKRQARKELLALLRINPNNREALKILEKWARSDLADIESAFQGGLYAQIPALVAQLHDRYPADRFPSLQPILDAADDYIERAQNELRTVVRNRTKRAQELADRADQEFERAMASLDRYRQGVGSPTYTERRYGTRSYIATVGSYKADAIMYFERALRHYREALALDPSLADPARGDLRRKIAECERYLSLLKSKRIRRLPPGRRSARRFRPQEPRIPGRYPVIPYPYGYPFDPLRPTWPYVAPYGSYPYGVPPVYPYGPPPVRR